VEEEEETLRKGFKEAELRAVRAEGEERREGQRRQQSLK
jgi:hypothetical protein